MSDAPRRSIALIDCVSFYASCERVFEPALDGRPIIVLCVRLDTVYSSKSRSPGSVLVRFLAETTLARDCDRESVRVDGFRSESGGFHPVSAPEREVVPSRQKEPLLRRQSCLGLSIGGSRDEAH